MLQVGWLVGQVARASPTSARHNLERQQKGQRNSGGAKSGRKAGSANHLLLDGEGAKQHSLSARVASEQFSTARLASKAMPTNRLHWSVHEV